MIFGTDVRLESPNPTPFIYQAKWKTWPFHILPISKIDPIHILFLKIDPFHILFFKFYPFIYFSGEKDTHWYTFDVKMIPIHILGGLKSIPHSSRTSVYTFIMEVTPPRDTDLLGEQLLTDVKALLNTVLLAAKSFRLGVLHLLLL